MSDTTIAIVQGIITILSAGGVAIILRQQIKSQQEQINAMKSNMDSMKAFIDIFKIDEIEKYVNVMRDTMNAEKLKLSIDAAKYGAEYMQQALKKGVIKDYHNLSERLLEDYKKASEKNSELTKLNQNQEIALKLLAEKAGLKIEEIEQKVKSEYSVYSIKDM